jgi:hypothetical protein
MNVMLAAEVMGVGCGFAGALIGLFVGFVIGRNWI